MKKGTIILIAIILIAAGIVYELWGKGYILNSTEKSLEEADFVKEEGYYLRYIEEDSKVKEVLDTEANNFVRIYETEGEVEAYGYNYVTDKFTYLYSFEGEEILKVVYNYATETVESDESDVFETLESEAIDLKTYFETLVTESNINIERL